MTAQATSSLLDIRPPARPQRRDTPLTETDAVDIWIARWLRHRRSDIVRRYRCDPRRIYEIWEGKRFPESRSRALKLFEADYPTLLDRVDFGRHKRIPRFEQSPDQLTFFDEK